MWVNDEEKTSFELIPGDEYTQRLRKGRRAVSFNEELTKDGRELLCGLNNLASYDFIPGDRCTQVLMTDELIEYEN
jgi:hypothetical protein